MAAYNAPFPHVDPFVSKINKLFQHLNFCLEQRRLALIIRYQDTQNDKAARLATRARKIDELSKHKESTERDLQLNELNELQNRFLAEIEVELEKAREPLPETRIVFKQDYLPLEQLIAELGEVLEEEMPLVPNYLTMRPVTAVVKEGRDPGEMYFPHAVGIDSYNRIFVVEGSVSKFHARISVFLENGEFQTSFTLQDVSEPHGLAIHGDYLYVTDTYWHTIFQFKMEPQFSLVTRQGIDRGSQIGEFSCPHNLTVSTNGDVYVADSHNHRVQILNSYLQHQRNLTEQQIQLPRDIKLTTDEVYVLCDDNPCLHVFSHAGERLRSLVSGGYQRQVTSPSCFCLDAAENIIISDWSDHRIKVFSNEGNLIKAIGEEGHQPGMLHFPTGLALTEELSLVVVSRNKYSALQIFS